MLMWTSTHLALMAAKDAEIADMREVVRVATEWAHDERVRHSAFVAEVAARAMDLSAPKPPVTLPAKKERTAVDTAIDLKAGNDRALRSYLGQWAQRELRSGKSMQDVADAIMVGESSDEEGVG